MERTRTTVDTSGDEVDVIIQHSGFLGFFSEVTTLKGRISHYEETHTGSGAGYFKFRKDVASAMGYSDDNFQLQVKEGGKWINVTNGEALDAPLQNCKKQDKKLYIRAKKIRFHNIRCGRRGCCGSGGGRVGSTTEEKITACDSCFVHTFNFVYSDSTF